MIASVNAKYHIGDANQLVGSVLCSRMGLHDNQYDKQYDTLALIGRGLESGAHDKQYDNIYDKLGHKKSPREEALNLALKTIIRFPFSVCYKGFWLF